MEFALPSTRFLPGPASLATLCLCALPLGAADLLPDGSFEALDAVDANSTWDLLAQNGSDAVFEIVSEAVEGEDALKVTVNALGPNPWDQQILSSAWPASGGQTYTVSLWAKADEDARGLRIGVQNTAFGNQFLHDLTLTTDWVRYEWSVTPTATEDLRFVVHFFEAGTFWLDDVRVDDGTVPDLKTTLELDLGPPHQRMVGLGAALPRYSERPLDSPDADALAVLLFDDLGMDIVRFQNWYFPPDYPQATAPTGMPEQSAFEATQVFHDMAKAGDRDIDVLVSSWGPPAALKSNHHTREGHLAADEDGFRYDEYVQYWVDSLDHLGFAPDYLSMQNEPGYTNPGWTTSLWRPTETDDLPGYAEALDLLWAAIKDRPEKPLLIGPEAENIGQAGWDQTLNTFRAFTRPLVEKDYVAAYAYHLYNVYDRSQIDRTVDELQMIRREFGHKPNFMTEYSQDFLDWLDYARVIHHTLVEANTSAYIHWKGVWTPAGAAAEHEDAMISITSAGAYEVHPVYYTIKHFARFIDRGYHRVGLAGIDPLLRATAFVSPGGSRLVFVVANTHATASRPIDWDLDSATVAGAMAYETTDSAQWSDLGSLDMAAEHTLPARSLTTFVVDLSEPVPVPPTGYVVETVRWTDAAKPFEVTLETIPGVSFTLWQSSDLTGSWAPAENVSLTRDDESTTLHAPAPTSFPAFYQVRLAFP